jgi:hypothetical protein
VDEEEVLEELRVRGDDTEIKHDLGPRSPPGIPLLEESKRIKQPVILCHRYIFRVEGDMLSLTGRLFRVPFRFLSLSEIRRTRISFFSF